NECVARLQALGAVCIAGNHDWAVIQRARIDDFNGDAARAVLWTRDRLDPSARVWLEACPETLRLDPMTLAHGSPREPIWEYVMSGAVAEHCLGCFDTAVCLIGHTHIPSTFSEQPDGRVRSA